MKNKSQKLIAAILLVTLLASCNTSNKVVSSFGKRKYTKGYFFNSGGHGKTELPVIAASKAPEVNNKTNYTAVNTKTMPSLTVANSISPVKQRKLNPINIPKSIIAKMQHAITKENNQNISLSYQSLSSYGVPGHGDAAEVNDSEYDAIATVSLVCGLLTLAALLLLYVGVILGFFEIIIAFSVVIGFICGIIGLKSKKNFGQALAGLIISAAIILLAILALVFVLSFG